MSTQQTTLPSGNITAGFSVSSGTNWQCVDEAYASHSETDYVFTNDTGVNDIYAHSGFAVPVGATVNYVAVRQWIRYDAPQRSGYAIIRVSGVAKSGARLSGGATYSGFTTQWTTNPVTTSGWTVADVNGTGTNALSGFGVKGHGAGDPKSPSLVYCSECELLVDFTPAAGAGYAICGGIGNVGAGAFGG